MGYVKNGPTPEDWPESEDRFHQPYADFEAVDSPFSIRINDRNHIRAGDDDARKPPRSRALGAFFDDEK